MRERAFDHIIDADDALDESAQATRDGRDHTADMAMRRALVHATLAVAYANLEE